MSKLNFQAVNDALDAETVVPQWLPGGKKRVREWVCANPKRNDANPGSFSVNLDNGNWKDFSTQEGGSDLVSLYAFIFCEGNQGDAVKQLAQNMGMRLGDLPAPVAGGKVKKIDDAAPRPVMPVPAGAPPLEVFKHPSHGEATRVWQYRNAEGQLLFYMCRFEPADGSRKQFSPYSWCDHPGKKSRWTLKGITGDTKRPLYGLDALADSPDAPVLMVEGEKAKDAAQVLVGDEFVAVSWMGGVATASAGRVDVKPLEGRRVVLMPDFDAHRKELTKEQQAAGVDPESMPLLPVHEQPGMVAMMRLAQELKGIAAEVEMVGYEINPALPGWDLSDALESGISGEKILAYIAKNSGDPATIIKGKPKAPPVEADEPPAPNVGLSENISAFGWPHEGAKHTPMNTVENLEHMMNEYGITAKYNQVRKGVELILPGRNYTLDNRANCSLAELASMCVRNKMPDSKMTEYVKLIADRNAYNPACEWIESKPWDGVPRMQQLLDTVTTTGEVWLKDALMRRWLLSAVAAIFRPFGFEGHGCLVFTGAQGAGKTTWFRRLVPDELRLVMVGAMLDPADKDSVVTVVSNWIVELGELDATFRKADIARLKAFIPKQADTLRRPFDRVDSEYQRRTVFGASVNDSRYLVDDTGNRRWWTVPVESMDYQHDIDMQQVWAEVLTLYRAGEQYHLTHEENEALKLLNEEHEAIDPVEQQIVSTFTWDDPLRPVRMTATQVLIEIGYDKPNKSQATHASKVLRKLTGGEPKKSGGSLLFNMPARARAKKAAASEDDIPWRS